MFGFLADLKYFTPSLHKLKFPSQAKPCFFYLTNIRGLEVFSKHFHSKINQSFNNNLFFKELFQIRDYKPYLTKLDSLKHITKLNLLKAYF